MSISARILKVEALLHLRKGVSRVDMGDSYLIGSNGGLRVPKPISCEEWEISAKKHLRGNQI